MALIEIDDIPSYKAPFMVGIFHGYVSHNQMVHPTLVALSRRVPLAFFSLVSSVPKLPWGWFWWNFHGVFHIFSHKKLVLPYQIIQKYMDQ